MQEVAELRRQIAMEQVHKRKKEKTVDNEEPTEFECCFCTTKVYRIYWLHCITLAME